MTVGWELARPRPSAPPSPELNGSQSAWSQASSLPEHVILDSDFSNLLGFARHPHPSGKKRRPPHLPVGPTAVYEVVALGCQGDAGPRPILSPRTSHL